MAGGVALKLRRKRNTGEKIIIMQRGKKSEEGQEERWEKVGEELCYYVKEKLRISLQMLPNFF